jgi:carbon starvation protein
MSLLGVVLLSALLLTAAYVVYGRLLNRWLRLDDSRPTPAVTERDDVDYLPTDRQFLLGQHFSAIAAAGPIVGPILAGVMFGWLPALLWILAGAIFIGGVHDFTALVASVRHRARSIAEVLREHMSRRSFVLFLLFVWIALVYIIVAFTDIVAASFVGSQRLDDGTIVTGGGIATSSLLYLALPVAMGLLLRFTRLPHWAATPIFMPLVGLAIWTGQKATLDLASILDLSDVGAGRLWGLILLAYCGAASMVPVWLLLQPRGYLGGIFLYIALLAGVIGIVLGNRSIEYPAFTGWVHTSPAGDRSPLVPMVFILIACGACSGFHCLIASGTTSKQLRRESDARLIGYGAMLLEAMVAVISLACVMTLALDSPLAAEWPPRANLIYGHGLGGFLEVVGIPAAIGVPFALLAFTTFVYDTLDVCTRLGRYIVQELSGLRGAAGRWLGTALTAGVPACFLLTTPIGPDGRPVPAWRTFWALFGASNQLLAALALIGVTVWLWRTYRARWVWPVVGLPTAWMYVMSTWALLRFVRDGFRDGDTGGIALPVNPVPWVALVLVGLAGVLLVEAVMVFAGRAGPPRSADPVPVSA